jgi:hypothetical protein
MDGMIDIIDLDIEYIGDGSAQDWNGTGKCSTHHGESDCYADIYSLCAVHVASSFKSWKFTECMFEMQGDLCADTFNPAQGECGASDYNPAYFSPVISNCTEIASFTEVEVSSLSECAIDPVTGLMGGEGKQLLLNSFGISAMADPVHQSLWVYIEGDLFLSDGFSTLADWGVAVRQTVCSTYATKNNTESLPAACN